MKTRAVRPHPKHVASRVEWWCVSKLGKWLGGAASPGTMREQAFDIRDKHRARGEAATVYAVTVSYRARRVEKRR